MSLSKRGSTLLVDLGETQDWLSDILDREEGNGAEIPGLADLRAGRAAYGEVIQRDLSSTLDVIPSGGEVSAEGLADIFAALASAYSFVILHASDWRAATARAGAEAADVVVAAAPEARLPRAVEDAGAALGDACSQILAFAEKRPRPVRDEETV